MIRVTASTFTIDAAAPDGTQARTITGIAVPYNVAANASGTEVMFCAAASQLRAKHQSSTCNTTPAKPLA
jgi:hypothetical protein